MFFGEQQIKRCINLKPHVFLPDLFIAFTDNVCQPLRTIARVQLMYQCQLPLFLISTEMIFYLTPNTPLIHTSFTYRKLNMDEICGLKFYLSCVHTSQIFLLKSLHAQRRSFSVMNLYF